MSNKKGGMERTGASSASNSKKRIYPCNLHKVKSREELLSLITWLQCVKNKYDSIRESHQRNRSTHYKKANAYPNNKERKTNLKPNCFNAFSTKKELTDQVVRILDQEFEDIPYESDDLKYLINYIINDKESGFGPYEDKDYFLKIWKYALETLEKEKEGEWAPNFDNTNNFDLWHGQGSKDFIFTKPHSLDIYNEAYEIRGPQNSPRGVNV